MHLYGEPMAKELKTESLNLRVAPGTKLALKGIAERENRSMVNALECLIADYYQRNSIEMPKAKIEGSSVRFKNGK